MDLELNGSTIQTIKKGANKIRSAVMSRSLQTLSKTKVKCESFVHNMEQMYRVIGGLLYKKF